MINDVIELRGASYELLVHLAAEHLRCAGQGLDLLDYTLVQADTLCGSLRLESAMPSGEKATLLTRSPCPSSRASSAPVARSQIRAVLSAMAVARRVPYLHLSPHFL